MKRKILAVVMAATMVCAVVSGCGSKGESSNGEDSQAVKMINGEELTQVGFSAPAMDNEFQTNLSDTLEQACKENGVKFTVAEAEQSAAKQAEQIENMVTTGCQAIVVSPVDLDGILDSLKNAKNSGAFIAMVGVVPPSKDYYDVVVNVEQTDLGSSAAKAAADWIEQTFPDAEDGSIEVALLTLDNSEEATKRGEALEKIEEYTSKAKIVDKYDSTGASSIPTKAQEYTEMCLTEHPNVKCILTYSDFMGIPADEVVMRTQGINPAEFGIFGCDYSTAGAEAIEKSKTNESTYRASGAFGVTFGKTVFDTIVGNVDVDDEGVYYEPAFELTVDNVDEYLK